MPRKIREWKKMLLQAGFSWRQGKASHTVWEHSLLKGIITLSGNDGDDVQKYQEKRVIKE